MFHQGAARAAGTTEPGCPRRARCAVVATNTYLGRTTLSAVVCDPNATVDGVVLPWAPQLVPWGPQAVPHRIVVSTGAC
jgi:hypothetical protein